MIGFRASQMLYYALIFSAYIVVGGLAILRVKGCALALLTLPLAVGTLKQCKLGVRTACLVMILLVEVKIVTVLPVLCSYDMVVIKACTRITGCDVR